MPSKTEAQHKAMAAACTGKSTTGIPKDVGCEFMHADKGKTFKGSKKKIKLGKTKVL